MHPLEQAAETDIEKEAISAYLANNESIASAADCLGWRYDRMRSAIRRVREKADALCPEKKEVPESGTSRSDFWGVRKSQSPEPASTPEVTPQVTPYAESYHKRQRYLELNHDKQHPELSPDQNERWLILPDMQIPYHDVKSLDAVLEYASDIRWDGFIQLGDFMDWDFISRWTVDNKRSTEGESFAEQYDIANAVLDRIEAAVKNKNPNARGYILEGNHDWRVENVIDKSPEYQGLIEMEKNLRLRQRNIVFWRYWIHRKPLKLGKAWFIHGDYTNVHHAKKHGDTYHRNVFYGHTHTRQLHTVATVAEDDIVMSE